MSWSSVRRGIFACAFAILTPSFATAQKADDYPNRIIKIVVPFAAGSTSDVLARMLQPRMSEFLKQNVIVENKPGAAGNLAVEQVARSEADGHTLLLGNVGTISINPFLFAHLGVDPVRDLAPVSTVAENVSILIANPKFPPKTVDEFIKYAKANPGKVNFASPGAGSLNRLKMELLRQKYGLDVLHVPYKGGGAPAVADLIAGHVNILFVTLSSALGPVQSGDLRALAVTAAKRLPLLPEVPTMVELKVEDDTSPSWQGILAPAGTPRPVIDKLHAAVTYAMADPELRRRLEANGDVPITSASPEAFKALIAKETERWSKIIRDANIKVE